MISMIKRIVTKYNEIINYLIIGVLTTIVSLSIYYFCVLCFLNPQEPLQLQAANIISWMGAVCFAYYTNRKYVFHSKSKDHLKEAATFISLRCVTLLVDMFCMFLLVTVLCINDKIAKLIVQVIITAINYIISKFLVFRQG